MFNDDFGDDVRKLYVVLIVLSLIYFAFGWVATKFDLVTREEYFAYVGLVGSLGTVAGLLALTRPTISQSDFKSVEIETLKSVTETVEQLSLLQSASAKTRQELDGLEVKKKEMELLVKKASLALFLKEQYSFYERQVIEEIEKNDRLSKALLNASECASKVLALNEEIEIDPNVNQLKEIISAASRRESVFDEALNEMPVFARTLLLISTPPSLRYRNRNRKL
ncbi:MAG: hypothetical protein HY254_01765 [Burkholderiales bacterium]|nr:hypothetical protein [Burkholderiales bacterium]